MTTTILKETFDNNLNCLLRLKPLDNKQTVTTIDCKDQNKDNVKSSDKPMFVHIRITDKCNLDCPYCYA